LLAISAAAIGNPRHKALPIAFLALSRSSQSVPTCPFTSSERTSELSVIGPQYLLEAAYDLRGIRPLRHYTALV
jgi:hypothetical protein